MRTILNSVWGQFSKRIVAITGKEIEKKNKNSYAVNKSCDYIEICCRNGPLHLDQDLVVSEKVQRAEIKSNVWSTSLWAMKLIRE